MNPKGLGARVKRLSLEKLRALVLAEASLTRVRELAELIRNVRGEGGPYSGRTEAAALVWFLKQKARLMTRGQLQEIASILGIGGSAAKKSTIAKTRLVRLLKSITKLPRTNNRRKQISLDRLISKGIEPDETRRIRTSPRRKRSGTSSDTHGEDAT